MTKKEKAIKQFIEGFSTQILPENPSVYEAMQYFARLKDFTEIFYNQAYREGFEFAASIEKNENDK